MHQIECGMHFNIEAIDIFVDLPHYTFCNVLIEITKNNKYI